MVSKVFSPPIEEDDFLTTLLERNWGNFVHFSCLSASIIFHLERHPYYPTFTQCVTFGFFSGQAQETAYNVFSLTIMYFLPLVVISFAYLRILWAISERRNENHSEEETYQGRLRLRRTGASCIERARSRTLRMTLVIVLAFICCWTPYVVMTLWYMLDRNSAEKVNRHLQDALFLMAVSNSCVNPLVYGTYAFKCPKKWMELLCFWRTNRMNKGNTMNSVQGHSLPQRNSCGSGNGPIRMRSILYQEGTRLERQVLPLSGPNCTSIVSRHRFQEDILTQQQHQNVTLQVGDMESSESFVDALSELSEEVFGAQEESQPQKKFLFKRKFRKHRSRPSTEMTCEDESSSEGVHSSSVGSVVGVPRCGCRIMSQ